MLQALATVNVGCRRNRLIRGNQMNKKHRHARKPHRPTYADEWSDDDVLDHPAVAWKSLQVMLCFVETAGYCFEVQLVNALEGMSGQCVIIL